MPEPCSCDACTETTEATDADLCAFCRQSCYPRGVIGGRTVPLAMSAASRAALHARARGEVPVGIDPRRFAQMAGRKIVDSAVEAAKPLAKEAVREGFRYLQRRLTGR